jgi:hypothetical protein
MTDYRALAERIDSEEFNPFLPASIDDMLDWLCRDGNLAVPCSGYGRDTRDCAPWAVAMVLIAIDANGTSDMAPMTEALEYDMGLVVNDSDGPLDLVLRHGGVLSGIDHFYVKCVVDEAEAIIVDNLKDRIGALPLPRLSDVDELVSAIEQELREQERLRLALHEEE